MKIVDFSTTHMEQAVQIAKQNYFEEKRFVPELPDLDTISPLESYVEDDLGVAAFDNNTMIGYMFAIGPFNNAFRSTNAIGVFSPMGSHGAVLDNRAKIYARMYQEVAKKWIQVGASSHAVCLYSHDKVTQEQFFRYGFGLRCVDAICNVKEITVTACEGYTFSKVISSNALSVLPLENMMHRSYLDSPFFMYRSELNAGDWMTYWEENQPICYASYHNDEIVAFIISELDGENFIKYTPGYKHITGMYCLPEHRGKGVSKKLLGLLIKDLKINGYTRLGVDYESINPSGTGFWQKYFTAYTHSVVRRIDEYAISRNTG